MTLNAVMTLLRSITYKPNYELSVTCNGGYVIFKMSLKTQDSCQPDHKTVISMEHKFDPYSFEREEQILDYVEMAIRNFEYHEMYEWFKVRGRQFRNPHR